MAPVLPTAPTVGPYGECVPIWIEAGLWGLLAGGALVLGALVAWLVRVPAVARLRRDGLRGRRARLGAGLRPGRRGRRHRRRAADRARLPRRRRRRTSGATCCSPAAAPRHRKRSASNQQKNQQGSGTAIALGALLDGVPESVVLGLSLLGGHGVGVPVLAAVFISNLPEGLSSTAGMKRAGRSARFVFGVWIGMRCRPDWPAPSECSCSRVPPTTRSPQSPPWPPERSSP